MTEQWQTEAAFATWHYSKDPTHVVFFTNIASILFVTILAFVRAGRMVVG